jgi:beta-mannosidase
MTALGEIERAPGRALLRPAPPLARHRVSSHLRSELDGTWTFVGLPADAAESPHTLDAAAARHGESFAEMRGAMGIAAALQELGKLSLDAPPPLDDRDWWIRCDFAGPMAGPAAADALTPAVNVDAASCVLVFQGLATIVDVWLNDEWLGRSDNMFLTWEADVSRLLRARNQLVMCARAMTPRLAPRRPRARWRARLLASQEWRWHRTTQLGRMPGFGPQVPPVGPWRPVLLERRARLTVRSLDVAATHLAGAAVLSVDALLTLDGPPGSAWLICGTERCAATVTRVGDDWRLRAVLESAELAAWWPHTHGEPVVHDSALQLVVAGAPLRVALGPIGFRSVALAKADAPFAISVNGTRPFLRGSCWTPRDWLRPELDDAQLDAEMLLLREAGINCIRLSGCFTYGSVALISACDRHGIMVWHDLMFSVLDYPTTDEAFAESCELELAQRLALLRSSACLLAICGSSEVDQQAAMSGVPLDEANHPLFHERLARAARRALPGVPYWPSTPSGGVVPMRNDVGTAHYFGVGAYQRPLDDARRSGVRFATECLAFSHLPEPESPAALVLDDAGDGRARWKARVPRDGGVEWDFEDVRDFYVAHLFGEDPARLRSESPARYLALGRAASSIVVERTFQEFRRVGSSSQGALTWLWADPWSGAGWGCVDASGRAKSAWYAMRHALQPVAIALSDEGLNGVDVHVWNDRPERMEGTLHVRMMRDGREIVHEASMRFTLEGGQSRTTAAEAVLGRFVDASFAYRFGERSHDVVHAAWVMDESSLSSGRPGASTFGAREIIAETSLLLTGDARPVTDTGLRARVASTSADGTLEVVVSADSYAQLVRVGSAAYRATDSYFSLVAGVERRVQMVLVDPSADRTIVVEALNDATPVVVRVGQPGEGQQDLASAAPPSAAVHT